MNQLGTAVDAASRPARQRHQVLSVGSVYLFVLAFLIIGRLISPGFWATENLLQVVKDVSILGVVAVGVAFITLSGHYVDLSIPAIMACSGIVAVYALASGFAVALLAGVATGAALGLVNGFMVGYLRLNPILWTLAAMSVFDGITRWLYGGKWVYVKQETGTGAAFASLYRGEWFGFIPVTVALFALVAVIGDFLMRRTGYGKQLKYTGASYEAARLTGINVRRTVMLAFLISGLTAALGGIVKTSFSKYGDVEIGLTYDFQAVTAVVIGGVTLAGGRGTMPGVIGGVLVIGLLGRILPLIPGLGQDEQFIIRGLIFVAAAGLNMLALRRAGRSDA
jgi:ribose/xylose/arabinose/galactoside ABC-type transport system permease subunit